MTTRLYAHTCAAAAVLLTIGSCWTALHIQWVGWSTLLTACLFAHLARRCYTQARRERALEQRLKRLGQEEAVSAVLPQPCCSFWLHSDGQIHSPSECTRPRAARTTLTTLEEQEFARLTSSLRGTGGAV